MTKKKQKFPILYIPDFYLKNFWVLFYLTILCYTPFLFNFLWGNHDWGWIKENTPLLSGMFEGRFSQFIIPTLLFDGNILPVFTLLTALAAFTTTALLLQNLWDIPQKKLLYILIGLNLTTTPYTLSWLYFAFITLSILSWGLFITLAFWLIIKKTSLKKGLVAVILLTLALGGYPPSVNLISTLFFTLIINDLCFNHTSLTEIIKKHTPLCIAIFISVFLFLIIQYVLKKLNLQHDTYNTSSISLTEALEKIPTLIITLKKELTQTTNFITVFYKYTWLILTIGAIITLYQNIEKKSSTLIMLTLSLAGLFFSSLITFIIAKNTLYVLNEPRIDFLSLPYVYIFFASILLRHKQKFIRNITSLALSLLIINNFHNIAYAAKVWSLGFKAETNLAERIIKRIEQNNAFSLNKNYTFIQGGTLDFRSRYYLPDNPDKTDAYTLTAPYIPWHLPSKAYQFYYPTDFIKNDFDIFWQFVFPQELDITPEFLTYIIQTATPWPHKDAVLIENNTIILTLTPDGKIRARLWLDKNINLLQ